jgi:hypothetical protein
VSVVCCQVEVYATSWSLVRRSPTGCCVAPCVWSRKNNPREWGWRPRPTKELARQEKKRQ